jgi:hypothetical protein
LGAILNNEITNRKHKYLKNVAYIMKSTFVYNMKIEDSRLLPCLTSVGKVFVMQLKIFTTLQTQATQMFHHST